jgi:cell division protein FtsQ
MMQRRLRTPRVVPIEVPWDAKLMNALANVLLLGFFAMVVGSALWWAVRHPSFSLQRITVDGDVAHSNEVTLRANVAPRLSGNFFTMDLTQARASFESVPWVRRAVVRREFPNRLRVTLEEHQPVAVWGNEGDVRMVNQQGELFEANVAEADVERMPRLLGPDAQSAEVLGLYRLISPLFGQLHFELSSLELTSRGSWRAHLEGGSVVELGRGQAPQVQERVLRLTQTLTQVASRYGRRVSAMESADLRHDNGYALRLRGVSTLETQPLKR